MCDLKKMSFFFTQEKLGSEMWEMHTPVKTDEEIQMTIDVKTAQNYSHRLQKW